VEYFGQNFEEEERCSLIGQRLGELGLEFEIKKLSGFRLSYFSKMMNPFNDFEIAPKILFCFNFKNKKGVDDFIRPFR
jgi:hypothetical protein